MPKRGGRSNYNNGSRFQIMNEYQNEHDNRDRNKDRNKPLRKVSFKPGTNRMVRISEMALRSRLEEDDEMGTWDRDKYEDRVGSRRKGSPIPKGKFNNRKLMPSALGWYQVTVFYPIQIQNGQRFSKDDLIRAILAGLQPDIFIPHYWRIEKNSIIFFVDDFYIAERLQQIDRTIQMSDGFRLFIRVRSGFPLVTIDDQFKEKMKIVMAKRYNVATNSLDLTRFHADPDFKNVFCALFRSPVMNAALDIIVSNIPNIVELNLSNNMLTSMESFKNIAQRLPHLTKFNLGENKIASLAQLLVLREIPIVDLILKDNPLRQRYKDQSLYVSEVRRKFPHLKRLDCEDLEPRILFDVNDTSALPKAQASFLCDTAGAEIIRQFLEQYFTVFDSNNRQPLLDAYHENAFMSISVPPASHAGRLTSFWKYNRNFKRTTVNEDIVKLRQLKMGRLAIVSTLAEWPKTKHDTQTFTVDLTLFTAKLIICTVTGLFKEYDNNASTNGDLRFFQRVLAIVPQGSGFCIRNEMIYVSSSTHAQTKMFHKNSAQQQTNAIQPAVNLQSRLQQNGPSTSAAAMLQPNIQPAVQPAVLPANIVPNQPDNATKMQMVQAMSAQSQMNLEWSKKCLEETNWDYSHAAYVFDKLHKEGKIPSEAFVK